MSHVFGDVSRFQVERCSDCIVTQIVAHESRNRKNFVSLPSTVVERVCVGERQEEREERKLSFLS